MTHPTPDPLREEAMCSCGAGHGSLEGHMDWCDYVEALAAAPQPAPAPAADERDEMIRAIKRLFRENGMAGPCSDIADALIADGYRKADPLADERERDAARAEGYRQGQENMRSRIASPLFLRPLVDEQSAGEWYEETLAADTQMYADAILAVPLAPEGS